MEKPAANAAMRQFLWWNFWVISLDCAFWMAGQSCMDASAVLPVYANSLTDSKLIIGLLSALPGVSWSLLQLVGAARILHLPRRKGYLLKTAALGRFPMLILPALLLFAPPLNKALILWVMVACYTLLFLTDGLVSVAWFDIIAKTIPSNLRGRFFGTMTFLEAVGGVGAGWIVKRVLADPRLVYPHQYGVLFAFFCAGLAISFILLLFIREPEGAVISEEEQPLGKIIGQMPLIWKQNPAFRKIMMVSWLLSGGGLVWPFYALYGIKVLSLPTEAGAIFIWAATFGNMAASPIWAWINDRKGPRSVMVGIAAIHLLSPLLALVIPLLVLRHPALALPGVGQYLYALVFLVNGIYFSGSLMGFLNYLLELATEEQRPLFIGLSNTLTAPALLAPLLGGWLVSLWSYEAVFVLALLFGILALFASLGLKEPKLESHPEPYIPPESGRLSG